MNVRSIFDRLYLVQLRTRQWLAARYFQFYGLSPRKTPTVCRTKVAAPRNLLLVIKGLLGDSVMCTPVILEARRLWPDARITVLGQEHNCQLLSPCDELHACFIAAAMPFTLFRRRDIRRLERWILDQAFDMSMILLGDDFAALLAGAKIPVRVGVRGTLLQTCLTHLYECGTPRTWGPNEKLNALRSLGYEVRQTGPRLWVSTSARASAAVKLNEMGQDPSGRYAVIHPFGSRTRQWWPATGVPEVAAALRMQYGIRSVLVGGEGETHLCREIRGDSLANAVGQFTIQELLAVIDGACLVISTDSGPFHIAGALRRPLVGLFRASRPEHAHHYLNTEVVFGEHPSCAGRCRWDCCRSNPCRQLQAISPDEIIAKARILMEA
jgi:ADP-heptose:LPS heptosyltransferase